MSRKLIAADFAAMEVRVFAHFSNEAKIQAVFQTGEDFYSRVAIDVFDRHDLSAHPNDRNFLKKVEPELRNKAKVIALAIVYGAGGYQVAKGLGLLKNGKPDSDAGDKIISKYLTAYPNLRRYMLKQEVMLKKHGYVVNQFGRVRKFDEAYALYKKYGDNLQDRLWCKRNGLSEEASIFNSAMNAAKNFPIQSTAASVINRAMIELAQWIRENKVDAKILLQVHDEVCIECDESITDLMKERLKHFMENNLFAKQLSVPLLAEPIVADNLGDAK